MEPDEPIDRARWLAEHLDLARWAVEQVEPDVRHLLWRPIVVDLMDGESIRISVDGSYSVPSMFSTDPVDAVAEVADYLQDALVGMGPAWPVCVDHDRGLHAVVADGEAVWRCNVGPHVVALIGHLT